MGDGTSADNQDLHTQLKSSILDAIHEWKAELANGKELRYELDGVQKSQQFIEQMLKQVQLNVEDNEDLTNERLLEIQNQLKAIKAGEVHFHFHQDATSKIPFDKIHQNLLNLYSSPKESTIEVYVGDEPRPIRVDQLFVNLAIVQGETERVRRMRNATPKETYKSSSNQTRSPTGAGVDTGSGGGSTAMSLFNMMTKARDGRANRIVLDNETIATDKNAQIEVEDIFLERRIGGQTIVPREIVLLGKAGIGKTTLCRYMCYRWAKGTLWRPASVEHSASTSAGAATASASSTTNTHPTRYQWVFHLRLKVVASDLALEGETNIAFILHRLLLHNCGLTRADAEAFWNAIVATNSQHSHPSSYQGGRILFVLDGFDEVRNKCAPFDALLGCRDLFANVDVLITSRPLNDFSTADLIFQNEGFKDENIPAYVRNYFEYALPNHTGNSNVLESRDRAARLIKFLEVNLLVKEICKVPINLEILCSIWKDLQEDIEAQQALTFNIHEMVMSDLYQQMLNKLMRRYLSKLLGEDALKAYLKKSAGKPFPILTCPESADVLKLLEELAFEVYSQTKSGNNLFEFRALQRILRHYPALTLHEVESKLRESGFIKLVVDIDDRNKSYEFVHKSFQEYLIGRLFARKFVQNTVRAKDREIVLHFRYDRDYQNIWVYTAGIIRTQVKEWKNQGGATNNPLHGGATTINNNGDNKEIIEAALYNFCTLFLSGGRDLYGMYELEMLVRLGEETKWQADMFVQLLEYLGRWTVGIAYEAEGVSRNHRLAHLSQIFATCPLAMAKVSYRGRSQLLNFLTFESRMPKWAERLVQTTAYLTTGELVQSCMHLVSGLVSSCLNGIAEVLFNSVCCRYVTCCDDDGEYLLSKCDHDEDSESTSFLGILCKCMQGLLCGLPAGLVFGILTVVTFALFFLLEASPLFFFALATGFVPLLIANFIYHPYYTNLQLSVGTLLKMFLFSEPRVVYRLMRMLLNADRSTCRRLLHIFEPSNFTTEMRRIVRLTLRRLLHVNSRSAPAVSRLAFSKLIAFSDHSHIAQDLILTEEAFFYLNEEVYRYCFDSSVLAELYWNKTPDPPVDISSLETFFPVEICDDIRSVISYIQTLRMELFSPKRSLLSTTTSSLLASQQVANQKAAEWLSSFTALASKYEAGVRPHCLLVILCHLRSTGRQNTVSAIEVSIENKVYKLVAWQYQHWQRVLRMKEDSSAEIRSTVAVYSSLLGPTSNGMEIAGDSPLFKHRESMIAEEDATEARENENTNRAVDESERPSTDHLDADPNQTNGNHSNNSNGSSFDDDANGSVSSSIAERLSRAVTKDDVMKVLSDIKVAKIEKVVFGASSGQILSQSDAYVQRIGQLNIVRTTTLKALRADLIHVAELDAQLRYMQQQEEEEERNQDGNDPDQNIEKKNKLLCKTIAKLQCVRASDRRALTKLTRSEAGRNIDLWRDELVGMCSQRIVDEIFEAGLWSAYWCSWRRDVVMVWMPVVLVYAAPVVYCFVVFGHLSHVTHAVLALIVVLEVLYAALYTWPHMPEETNSSQPSSRSGVWRQLSMHTRTVASALFYVFICLTMLPLVISILVCFFMIGLAVGYDVDSLELDDICFMKILSMYFSLADHLEPYQSISALYAHLSHPIYFKSLLHCYPGYTWGCLFNGHTALPHMLRTQLSEQRTALWEQDSSTGLFLWFQGKTRFSFTTTARHRLRFDVTCIRLLRARYYFDFRVVTYLRGLWRRTFMGVFEEDDDDMYFHYTNNANTNGKRNDHGNESGHENTFQHGPGDAAVRVINEAKASEHRAQMLKLFNANRFQALLKKAIASADDLESNRHQQSNNHSHTNASTRAYSARNSARGSSLFRNSLNALNPVTPSSTSSLSSPVAHDGGNDLEANDSIHRSTAEYQRYEERGRGQGAEEGKTIMMTDTAIVSSRISAADRRFNEDVL